MRNAQYVPSKHFSTSIFVRSTSCTSYFVRRTWENEAIQLRNALDCMGINESDRYAAGIASCIYLPTSCPIPFVLGDWLPCLLAHDRDRLLHLFFLSWDSRGNDGSPG